MKRILGWCDAFARKIAFVAAVLLAASAQAFNWSDYPAGAVVPVTGSATATDADMATINAYSKLCFASGTRITFDVSGDVSLTCPVAATGTIVKCGTGAELLREGDRRRHRPHGQRHAADHEVVVAVVRCVDR